MTRRQAREQAFVLLFEKSFREDEELQEIIDAALENEMLVNDEFSLLLAKTADENLDVIDSYIVKYSRGWTLRRIPKVCLALMRLAVAEMFYIDSIPVNVSINEAVELSKIYGEATDSNFINGILGSISRDKKDE